MESATCCGQFRMSLGRIDALAEYNTAVATFVRDFQPGDFETLWRMDQECFAPGVSYSKPELMSFINRSGAFTLVATDAKEIQGFIVTQGGKAGHVITIDVSPQARRSGVGSLLLRGAEDRLVSSGSRIINLETAVDNVSALAFYRSHGYRVVRTWPRYYANGVDALVLKKILSNA
ncbi:MAG TPA: GNAT family N-acetyltransferase [Candidatus Eisenbacteria bacterium]|nr:GNAT family N-acetyltransferase [Candidatus Eisenbacteria bacterium]